MAHVIEGVSPDAWLPPGKKFLNEQLVQDINRTAPPVSGSDSSGWAADEQGLFRDQALEPSRVVKYERLVVTTVRRRGTIGTAHEISVQYRAWADDGKLLGHWTIAAPEHSG